MEKPRRTSSVIAVVGLIVAVCVFCDLLIGPVFEFADSDVPLIIGLAMGFTIGQLNLISVWAAMSHGSPIMRLPWACLMLVLMWTSIIVGIRIVNTLGLNDRDTLAIGIVLLLSCLTTQVPLWIASRVFGWRLTHIDQSNEAGQFNLRQMFVGTILLAISLAASRLLLPTKTSDFVFELDGELSIVLPIMAAINLITVTPAIWGALRKLSLGLALILWATSTFLFTVIECVVLAVAIGDFSIEIFVLFIGINAAQVAIVFVALKALSAAGFRLERQQERQSEEFRSLYDELENVDEVFAQSADVSSRNSGSATRR